jgi:hypothetical protein
MKNRFLPLIIVSFALLTGCTTKPPVVNPTPTPVVSPQSKVETVKLAGLLAKGSSVKCQIAKSDGADAISFVVKNKKTKAMGSSLSGGKGTGYMLNDTEYMYIWNDSENKGIKISLASPSSSPSTQYQDFSRDEVEQDYVKKGYTYTCEEAVIDDSEFVLPKDIVFSDLSAMMEQTKKLQVSPGKTPSAEQIEDMMKQYGQ